MKKKTEKKTLSIQASPEKQAALEQFLKTKAAQIYEETKAMRGCRHISPETYTLEIGPLEDYD